MEISVEDAICKLFNSLSDKEKDLAIEEVREANDVSKRIELLGNQLSAKG